jgi:heat shock protein HtpX
MTDFHRYSAQNSRKSAFFTLASFILLGVLISAVCFYFFDPNVAAISGLSISAIIIVILYFNASRVAVSLSHAKEVDASQEPMLHNIIEEMTIASGITKPKVYVIEDAALNAFAAGDAKKGHVVFTRGILGALNRDELQGVAAHELSHLRNGDSKLMTIVASVGLAIGVIADIASRMFLFGGNNNNNNSGPLAIVAIVVAIAGIILAPLLAVLIQSAISREREWLADSTAVGMTRNPTGLRKALETLANPDAITRPVKAHQSTSHLWITEPLLGFNSKDSKERKKNKKDGKKPKPSKFSTHPPLEDRIQRLKDQEVIGG